MFEAGDTNVQARNGSKDRAVDELASLVRDLGTGLKARVEAVEAGQQAHRDEVEARLSKYEEVQERVAERVISSVERLARLETIPERLDVITRQQAAQARWAQKNFEALNLRISGVEARLGQDEAKQTGQRQAARVALESFKFLLDYGWKIAVVVTGGLWALQAYETGIRPQVTIQQPAQSQAGAQDWPLRTN